MDIDDIMAKQETTKIHCQEYDLQEDLQCP